MPEEQSIRTAKVVGRDEATRSVNYLSADGTKSSVNYNRQVQAEFRN